MIITDKNIPDDPTELRQFAARMLTGFTEFEDKHAGIEACHMAEIQNRDMMITKLRYQLLVYAKINLAAPAKGWINWAFAWKMKKQTKN